MGSFLDRVTYASDSASGRDGNHVPTGGMTNKEADAAASLPKAKPCFVDPLRGFSSLRVESKTLAERKGFEPPVPCGTSDFESDAIDHSATSPYQK